MSDVSPFIAAIALLVSLFLTRAFMRPGSPMHVLDHPNSRSLHSQPTPRSGGIAIVLGIIGGAVLLSVVSGAPMPSVAVWLGATVTAIACVSFIDDRWGLRAGYRLTLHALAASVLLGSTLAIDPLALPGVDYDLPPWLSSLLTVLYVVWMTNLYNFMDGMDGFAAGMAVFGFGTLGGLGLLGGNETFAALNFIVAASVLGFLVFNFPPAKIFMGDSGSSSLGFLAAGMSVWANSLGLIPLWLSAVVFAPFIVDATVTLLRRAVRGEKIWQAHSTHYYQRLVRSGWGHRKTVLLQYVLMAVCACAALAAFRATTSMQWAIVIGIAAVYVALFFAVSRIEARHQDIGQRT